MNACICLAALSLNACSLPGASTVERQSVERLKSLRYPKDAQVGPDLDILVRDLGQDVRLANRTARSYSDKQLWINRHYVREVTRINVGPNNVYPLESLVNEYGERFPVPGILSPDGGSPVVLAELYDPQTQVRNRLLILDIPKSVTGVETQQ